MANLLTDLPKDLSGEVVEILATNANVRIERIVSNGQASPKGFWYDQAEHEWVLVVAGAACLQFDDGAHIELGRGDHLLIPAHRKHRIEWTSTETQTIWLAVFYEP